MPSTPKTLKKLFKSQQNRLSGRSWGNIAQNEEDPIFEGYRVPDISNPEKIEAHFPVVVTHEKDEVYKVTWHLQHLKDWRNTRPETWDEYQDYDDYCEARLKYALTVYAGNYKLLPIENPDELFRFEVKKWTRTSMTRKNSPNKPKTPPMLAPMLAHKNTVKNNIPKFHLLNDIKNYFPVVWHKDPQNPKLLGIQLHKMKMRALARNAGQPEREFEAQMISRLIKALESSETTGAWKVLAPASRDYVCMLQLLK
jgi:hypothetical protein